MRIFLFITAILSSNYSLAMVDSNKCANVALNALKYAQATRIDGIRVDNGQISLSQGASLKFVRHSDSILVTDNTANVSAVFDLKDGVVRKVEAKTDLGKFEFVLDEDCNLDHELIDQTILEYDRGVCKDIGKVLVKSGYTTADGSKCEGLQALVSKVVHNKNRDLIEKKVLGATGIPITIDYGETSYFPQLQILNHCAELMAEEKSLDKNLDKKNRKFSLSWYDDVFKESNSKILLRRKNSAGTQ